MGTKTGIEWTDHTFNPWIGCTKVSAGCANCYAKTRDDRHMLGPVSHWGPGAPRHVTSTANWREVLKWAKAARAAGERAKVFCASQADIFEAEAPIEARRRLWSLISETYDALDWQLLTKRPENIGPVMGDDGLCCGFFEVTRCWLGTSTEDQVAAEKRIPSLLDVDAAIRFISAEPLLGPINLGWIPDNVQDAPEAGEEPQIWGKSALIANDLWSDQNGVTSDGPFRAALDWVICGGESGHGARAMNPDWARSLRDQCVAAGVPFFFKQWGEWAPGSGPEPRNEIPIHAHDADGSPMGLMHRAGKKAAGAMLDGREYKAFPEVRA